MRYVRLLGVLAISVALFYVAGCSDDDDNGNGTMDGQVADFAATDGGTTDTGGGGDDGGVEEDASAAVGLSCQAEYPCVSCCPQDDTACADACVAALSAEAKQAKDDFENCRTITCADECSGDKQACLDCLDTKCAAERAACGWGAKGSKTCTEIFDCLDDCPMLVVDQSGTAETCPSGEGLLCLQACYSEGDQEGAALTSTAGGCMYEKCNAECVGDWKSTACATCRDQSCASEWQACSDDT